MWNIYILQFKLKVQINILILILFSKIRIEDILHFQCSISYSYLHGSINDYIYYFQICVEIPINL